MFHACLERISSRILSRICCRLVDCGTLSVFSYVFLSYFSRIFDVSPKNLRPERATDVVTPYTDLASMKRAGIDASKHWHSAVHRIRDETTKKTGKKGKKINRWLKIIRNPVILDKRQQQPWYREAKEIIVCRDDSEDEDDDHDRADRDVIEIDGDEDEESADTGEDDENEEEDEEEMEEEQPVIKKRKKQKPQSDDEDDERSEEEEKRSKRGTTRDTSGPTQHQNNRNPAKKRKSTR